MWLNVVLTPGTLLRRQRSGTGASACCGYCCPLCPTGGQYSGKIRFIGRDCVGIVEGSCVYRANGVSNQGKFVLSRNPGYKTKVVAM